MAEFKPDVSFITKLLHPRITEADESPDSSPDGSPGDVREPAPKAAPQNCWEFKRCGREPGGHRVAELGVCPAALFEAADGFCGGSNGGRACSYITGTECDGAVHGTRRDKLKDCERCEFHVRLDAEHGHHHSTYAFLRFLQEHVRQK